MPAVIDSKYPLTFGFALSTDDKARAAEQEALAATFEQIMRIIDGRADVSNKATFKVSVKFVPLTEEILKAIVALNKWVLHLFRNR